ncbi:malto-oligosyltrehalose synthase [Hoeflea ulvae]|uniref:Malto-oligosyltrehalose synthase n=1 Tax=Hoeflea ulvae TaxID=2983764 RepID=A0ABT3YLY4_9HYPH|nr:malto-oligosyltrehalose synthase [Hoeflea ulvae]MCY0096924.1 malto-oligosyltrehalose synthase [Hoeflea ulvae]
MTPRATYRFQFHKGFTFADAQALVGYLDSLGISHVYSSPITVATRGSMHGYDVVDPTEINPELGGEEAFRSLVAELRARGMGIIIDIVPNHMGVAGGENLYWNDVLRNGRSSRYASFFDIDWSRKLLLPLLGAPLPETLADGHIAVDVSGDEPAVVLYGEQRVPLRPEDHDFVRDNAEGYELSSLLERQHYRLGWWRTADDVLNWRRFFTISELAGLRIEDPEVFEATHALYFRLYGEGLIDGVRVDHVDGLTDPAGYCRLLRTRLDAISRPESAPQGPAYIIIEKILGPGEALAADWGVNGTSGYDFMEQVSALLHDPAGEAPMKDLWRAFSGRELDFHQEELLARQEMLDWAFTGQLDACVAAFEALARSRDETAGLTGGMLRRAIRRMLWVFPVYRTYGTGTAAPSSDAGIRDTVRQRAARFTPPGEGMVVDRILDWLAGTGPGDAGLAARAVQRFQQLSAPIAAKSVEDTAFYRYGLLLSRTDVGFDAARFALPATEFHRLAMARAKDFPGAMLATATHDHKRGEDVRARLAVLGDIPDMWRERVTQWDRLAGAAAEGVDAADRYMLYQTLFGAWPPELQVPDRAGLDAFADRIVAWQQKALREAKLRSSWQAPQEAYEQRCETLVRTLLDPADRSGFLADLQDLVSMTSSAALGNMLVQVALRYTMPGVPDLYQGCELADFSLVDPDNRRAVDYEQRKGLLAGAPAPDDRLAGGGKLRLIRQLLQLRRHNPDLFAQGSYLPVTVSGPRADHVLAFRRVHGAEQFLCVVVLHCGQVLVPGDRCVPPPEWWGETVLEDGSPVAELLAQSPVFVSEAGSAPA